MSEWEITIDSFQGYAPAYWESEFTSLGLKGHSALMRNVDMTNPNVLTQGPGLLKLVNGDNAAAITTLIKGMLRVTLAGTDGSYSYGVGGAKVYKYTLLSVIQDGTWPHAITSGSGQLGEDIIEYAGKTYYSWNKDGNAGDIGRYDPATNTFVDNYMSSTPAGAAALQNVTTNPTPHQLLLGGDNKLYCANGRYVASFDGTTFVDKALNLPADEVIQSIVWNHNRIFILSNKPNTSTNTAVEASVYIWDTYSTSWEYQIKIIGQGGALLAKNGSVFVWYRDISFTGGYKLGQVGNEEIVDTAFYTGQLPSYYQICEHRNHLVWMSGQYIMAFGTTDLNSNPRLFQYAPSKWGVAGGINNVFGTPIVASQIGGTYELDKFSGYSTDAYWKSIMFDISNSIKTGLLKKIFIFTEPLSPGAKLDVTVTADYGKATTACDQIAYTNVVTDQNYQRTRWGILDDDNGIQVENFRLDLSWANGDANNPVKIRKIVVQGRDIDNV